MEGLWLYTDIYDEDGRLIDPCKGDSGGPLAIKRNGEWELVGVLKVCFQWWFTQGQDSCTMKWSKFVQGEGYDCTTNKINGDGLWSRWCHSSFVFSRKYFTLTISVAAQHKWILRQLQPGGGKGFCSCARYICDILMQFLATKVTHVDALEVRWDTPERMDRRAWGFECSGVYVGTKL